MKDVKERCPEVDDAVLFGSLARGDAVPGSDADVLVLLKSSATPFHQRSARYMPRGLAIGVDLFAYTQNELEEMQAADNPFIARALREGISLL